MKVNRLTPVLMVDAIEPCLPFWIDRLGFSKTVEVPDDNRLGFVILVRDGVEIMYQTRNSVRGDVPALADAPMGGSMLYIDVEDLNAIEQSMKGATFIEPRRTTFYGAQEIIVREPGGNSVAFAEYAKK